MAVLEASNHATSIEYLCLSDTDLITSVSGDVSKWAAALKKMTALKELTLWNVQDHISDKEMSILHNATHASDIYFWSVACKL